MEENKSKNYDIVDTIKNQVYLDDETLKKNWGKNYTKNINKIKQAIIETKGEYLTYNNEIITAFFFSTSNGKTENCEEVFKEKLPYLKSVNSSWDLDVNPNYKVEKTISLKEFYNKLGLNYNKNLTIKVLNYTEGNSIKTIKINNKTYKGTDVRYKLNLKSADFTIEQNEDNVKITTRGNGHGVGMSQYGANAMALKGNTYDKILKYYYKDVEITKN